MLWWSAWQAAQPGKPAPTLPVSAMQRVPLPETVPAGVEVWRFRLNLDMPIQARDLSVLSADEHVRALRFHRHEDRVRAVATRAALRRLLASCVRRTPESLCFAVNRHGKPRIDDEDGVEFNVSHSGSYALIALSTLGPIGVDIEHLDRRLNVKQLGSYVFTRLERLVALQESNEAHDFLARWVAKESVLKALGQGISEHLQTVSILPGNGNGEGYDVVSGLPEWRGIKAWPIGAPAGYRAALALGLPESFTPLDRKRAGASKSAS